MNTPHDVPSRMELDLQAHARTLSALTEELGEQRQAIAVMTTENRYRDEKIASILSLGRTVLITVITLAVGLAFGFLASGGFRVPTV